MNLRKTQSLTYYKNHSKDRDYPSDETHMQHEGHRKNGLPPCSLQYSMLQGPPPQAELSSSSPNSILWGSKQGLTR